MAGKMAGWFFDCAVTEVLGCTLYDDRTGAIARAGTVVLTDWQKVKYKSAANVHADIEFFDGEQLHLTSRTSSILR